MNKVQNEVAEVLKKHNSKLGYEITFPMYRVLPDEVKLALSVLGKHNMQIVIIFKSLENKKK